MSETGMICGRCGGSLAHVPTLPLMRCPHCGEIGAPDRAERHLIPWGWTCEACDEPNPGLRNFCQHCGHGLTSICVRCERPVTTAVCHNCGTHQARAIQFTRRDQRRAEWVPVLRAHAREVTIDQRPVQAWAAVETPPPPPDTAALSHPPRRDLSSWLRRAIVIMPVIVLGAALAFVPALSTLALETLAAAGQTIQLAGQQAGTLSALLVEFLSAVRAIQPGDPRYSLVMAGIVLFISLLPLTLYLIVTFVQSLARLMRRFRP